MYCQLTFERAPSVHSEEKVASSMNGVGKTWYPHAKKKKKEEEEEQERKKERKEENWIFILYHTSTGRSVIKWIDQLEDQTIQNGLKT